MRKRITPGTVLGLIAVMLCVSGTAFAATKITSNDIKDGTIKSRDLSASVKDKLNKVGKTGPAGKNGTDGATGPQGPAGAKGETGAVGAPGADGDDGANGRDAVTYVTSLAGAWTGYDRNDACDGNKPTSSLATLNGHLVLGEYEDGNAASGASFKPADLKLADLDALSYSERAEGGINGYNAAYVKVMTAGGGDGVVFTPSSQAGGPGSTLEWRRHNIVRGSVRYDDDAGTNPDISWADLLDDHGDEAITEIRVQAGCSGGYSDGSTALVDDITLVAGDFAASWDFE